MASVSSIPASARNAAQGEARAVNWGGIPSTSPASKGSPRPSTRDVFRVDGLWRALTYGFPVQGAPDALKEHHERQGARRKGSDAPHAFGVAADAAFQGHFSLN